MPFCLTALGSLLASAKLQRNNLGVEKVRAGGNVVLLYAAKYHGVHRVVNISSRFDLKKCIEDRLGKNYLERMANTGFIDIFSKTSKLKEILFRLPIN